MRNNIIKKIASSVAGTALSLAVVASGAAEAATFKFDFHNFANTRNFGGGSLSFDDESLTGNGPEVLEFEDLVNANFNFNFNYLSTNLDETHLAEEPTFSFVDGELAGLKFLAEKVNIHFEIEFLFVEDLNLNFFRISLGTSVFGQVSFETVTAWQPPDTTDPTDPIVPVPEPSSVAGLVILGLGGLLIGRSRSARKS